MCCEHCCTSAPEASGTVNPIDMARAVAKQLDGLHVVVTDDRRSLQLKTRGA